MLRFSVRQERARCRSKTPGPLPAPLSEPTHAAIAGAAFSAPRTSSIRTPLPSPLMPTRAEIDAQLDRLEALLPGLVAEHPDEADFGPAFAGEADVIQCR